MSNIFCISGAWALKEDPRGLTIDQIVGDSVGYISAAVPGNVQKDLENAGVFGPLWYGPIDPKLYGVATKNWWYKKTFTLPEDYKGKRVTLYFDGVDYSCEVYIGNKFVGSHAGMFERFEFDVTDFVTPGESADLYVKIDKMPPELLDYVVISDGPLSAVNTPYHFVTGNDKIRTTLKGLKAAANLSYDWGTNIYTLGIWKDVYFKASGDARIDWVQVKTEFEDDTYKKATVITDLEIEAACDTEVTVELTLNGNGIEKKTSFTAKLTKGENLISGSIDVEDPLLWWPVGYGEQPLYFVNAVITDAKGSDEKLTRFGFRDVKWVDCEGAPEDFEFKYMLKLNGVEIRTMGSNLTSVDLLFGTAVGRGRHYVEMAKNCGFNFLRFHGGSWGHHEDMYDACDELGILVSSEFPMGNCCIENDEELMDNLDVTYKNLIKQFRNHPAIVEWTGGNELNWYFLPDMDRTALYRQRAAAAEADSTRLFRDTCPVPGSRHAPWDYNPDLLYGIFNLDPYDNFTNMTQSPYNIDKNGNYRPVPVMRWAEFGCHTPSNIEVWNRDIPEASRWPINEQDPVLSRKNAVCGCFQPSLWFGLEYTEALFGKCDDLEMAIKGGQYLGGEGMRYQYDCLRNLAKRMGGITNWDYNEPWPNGAGSYLIDYDGRPVMAYYFVKQAMAPIAISLKYDHVLYDFFNESFAEIRVISDKKEAEKDLSYKVIARDRHGNIYDTVEGKIDVIDHIESKTVGKVRLNPPLDKLFGPVFIELYLYDSKGDIISERVSVLGCKGLGAPLRGLLKDDMMDYGYGGTYVMSGMCGGKVQKTEIEIADAVYSQDNENEYLAVTIKNKQETGLPALFCELRPVNEYQPKLYFDVNFISVPAGESRTITVSRKLSDSGLPLKYLGFTAECWNAPTVTIPASDDVILAMGKKDGTTFEYDKVNEGAVINAENGVVPAALVPYIVEDETVRIEFTSKEATTATVIINLADNDNSDITNMLVTVNDETESVVLEGGLGVQKENYDRLAFPKTVIFETELKKGENSITFACRYGWYTFDSAIIVK